MEDHRYPVTYTIVDEYVDGTVRTRMIREVNPEEGEVVADDHPEHDLPDDVQMCWKVSVNHDKL